MNDKEQDVRTPQFLLLTLLMTLIYIVWIYSGYASDEEGRLGEEQTETRADSNSDTTTEGTSEEVVIAVMGVTGSGKSTFIRAMTGNDSVHVGHGLESGNSIFAFE